MMLMGKALDLTGQKFGRLTVIERVGIKNSKVMWRCKCDCGNYTETSTSSLRKGDSRSCGCLRRENVAKATTSDLLGKRFGKLVVVERIGSHNGNAVWKCKCDCGNYCDVVARSLVSGHTKSCGCLVKLSRFNDIAWKRFGKLIAIKYLGKSKWCCKCDCGMYVNVLTAHLTSGHTKSCGCLQCGGGNRSYSCPDLFGSTEQIDICHSDVVKEIRDFIDLYREGV